MQIKEDIKLDYKDVLICPKRSTLRSRKDVDLNRTFKFKHTNKALEAIPIVAANMDGVGTMAMAKSFFPSKLLVALHKHYSVNELVNFFDEIGENSKHVFYTIGLHINDLEKLEEVNKSLIKGEIHNICIDVANGYTERFLNFVKEVREKFPDKIIMAGNVVTPEMTEQLILGGADIVKVGIGPGSVCLTRNMAGVGYPQLSAVMECADAAHGLKGLICADGGCEVPGDVAKALGGGADFVMLGSLLAGHQESEMEIILENDEKFIHYYGSSSEEAMKKHHGGMLEYRASEGKSVQLPFKGNVEKTIHDILGGLRSTCTYIGAEKLKDVSKQTTFIRVNRQLNISLE
ncbi:MAG: GMP reductase [bacterium]|nr:GMP reductase [bacterium]